MKTVILGAGALGTVIAAHLARAGENVALVAREPRASLIAREGARVTGIIELDEQVPVFTDLADIREADLVINALKTYQSPAVLGRLLLKRPALALSVQNGVYKNIELSAAFGRENVLGSTAMISAEVLPDGAARFTINQELLVGELDGKETARCNEVAAMLRGAGINAATSPDIVGIEWSKVCFFVPAFCLALMTRMETYRFLSHPDTAAIHVALVREMAQLAAAEGVHVPDTGLLSLSAIVQATDEDAAVQQVLAYGAHLEKNAPRHKVSGLQDLERGRPTEVNEIVGHAVRRSDELGLSAPTLRMCYGLCRVISPVVVGA